MAADMVSRSRDLGDLLALQKEAIRRGDIAALSALVGPMTEHLERLARMPVIAGKPPLERLKRQAEENQRLLGAALRGIQAAASRVKEIAGVGAEFRTYDSHGQSAAVSFRTGTMERRA